MVAIFSFTGTWNDGVDVRGYLYWSLLDNYEWGSYEPTFGLVAWDRETFARRPKPSLAWLGEVAHRRRARPHQLVVFFSLSHSTARQLYDPEERCGCATNRRPGRDCPAARRPSAAG
ncbi:family 1 glycosylhydrolase [Nonomuraea salmonea]|uniref:family 1 glycosylhydrolase n=1 Tax=Nonomuraea salmonea TaxID=46181 RepID=UPI002FE89823